jgi:outer membrane protein OmpA-like peptidoglycan-associated protein
VLVTCLPALLLVGCRDSRQDFIVALSEETNPSAGVSRAVYFAVGSARVSPEGRVGIRAAAAAAKQNNAARILVAGYTDTVGPADLNERLSKRRAEAVAAELEAAGVPPDQIKVVWHGEESLRVPTADGRREGNNRVVTITFD